MEKRRFVTLIREDHKLGGNVYVEGRVTGMAYVICEVYNTIPHGHGHCDEGMVFILDCTKEQYERFIELTEEAYPGLCKFYYEGSE